MLEPLDAPRWRPDDLLCRIASELYFLPRRTRATWRAVVVFGTGLTNVETTIAVHDTESLQQRQFVNQAGSPFEPLQDLSSFDACP